MFISYNRFWRAALMAMIVLTTPTLMGAGKGCGGFPGADGDDDGGYDDPSGSCSDNGKSCETDSVVYRWKSQCASNSTSQAPCYCAAAATYDCFLRHGCYQEAGVATSVTKAQLLDGKQSNASNASALGTRCF